MIFLDSTVFVALLKEEDEFRPSSEKIFFSIKSGKVKACASVVSLMEVAFVLRKLGRQEKVKGVVGAFLSLEGLEFLPCTGEVFSNALECLDKLDLSDALIASTATLNGFEEIVTADKDFEHVGFVKPKNPKEV